MSEDREDRLFRETSEAASKLLEKICDDEQIDETTAGARDCIYMDMGGVSKSNPMLRLTETQADAFFKSLRSNIKSAMHEALMLYLLNGKGKP
jgi:hypothetical protein